MKLIRKGAEGDLFFTTWNGKEAILKSRKKKDYRNSSLDYRLRKQRTISDDHAVDLRLFKEILNSAHADIFEKAWSNFLSGYKSSVGKERFEKITNKVMIIESRGRYAKVV